MERLLLLLTLLFATSQVILADPAPEQFLEIPWGAQYHKVRDALAKRPGMTWKSEGSAGSELHYERGEFAGLDVERWAFAVGERGFFHATFIVKPPADGSSAFRKLKQMIAEKYGGGREEAVGKPGPVYYDWVKGEYAQGSPKKPARGTTWSLQTSFTRHTIEIGVRPHGGNGARVDYHNATLAKAPQSKPSLLGAPTPKKRDL